MICDVVPYIELFLKSVNVKSLYGSSPLYITQPPKIVVQNRLFTIIDIRDLHIVIDEGG